MASYNVFIDHPITRQNVAVISTDRPYDASAVAHFAYDHGWKVFTDLWSETVPDAMVSPKVFQVFELGRFVRTR